MKLPRTNRASAAGLGLAVLLLTAVFGRADDVRPRSDPPSGLQAAVEPSEDPGLDPAMTKDKAETRTPERIIRQWERKARASRPGR